MMKNIIALLEIDEFLGQSELIDIAKGKNELTLNPIKIYKQKRRRWLRKK